MKNYEVSENSFSISLSLGKIFLKGCLKDVLIIRWSRHAILTATLSTCWQRLFLPLLFRISWFFSQDRFSYLSFCSLLLVMWWTLKSWIWDVKWKSWGWIINWVKLTKFFEIWIDNWLGLSRLLFEFWSLSWET